MRYFKYFGQENGVLAVMLLLTLIYIGLFCFFPGVMAMLTFGATVTAIIVLN